MKIKIKKIFKTIRNVFVILLGLTLIFLIGTSIWNKVNCLKEDKALSKVGTYVKVNGTNISVSVTGEGDKTIVLLSGLGTTSPIIDFKPLAEKLSLHYQVVTLEYAGYGLSEDSKKKRTNETIVEEIRSTLSQLGIKPPYILVPHSISGVYALAYMNTYPEEVEAMIGIDSSVPNQAKYEEASKIPEILYYFAKFQDITGLTRLINLREAEYLQEMEAGGSYSKEDMKNVFALNNRKSVSRALLSESRAYMENCKELYDVKCPENIPVLFILSNSSCKQYKEFMKSLGKEETWDGLHEEVISNPQLQKITYLEGGHYLHWTQSQAIADLVNSFIQGKQ